MQLIQPTDEQSLWLLRVVKSVLGPIDSGAARYLIDASQRHWLQSDYNWEELEPLPSTAWSDEIANPPLSDPLMAQQLIQSLVILAIVGDRRNWHTYHCIRQLARRLKVKNAGLRYLQLWCLKANWLLILDVYWHGFIAQKYRYEWRRRGWRWLLGGAATYLGWMQNRALTQQYRQLQWLPPTTLGHAFWQFYQQHHYAFPGERQGLHEGLAFHDVTHILGDFDISPEGELQAVALTAGYQQFGDALASLIFIILQQHSGIQIGLLSQAQQGWLARPNVADHFVRTFVAGAAMTVDLAQTWDFWDAVEHPVAALRQRYNLTLNCPRETG